MGNNLDVKNKLEKENKTISIKLKSFTAIGILVISGSILLSLSAYFSNAQTEEYIISTLKTGLIFVFVGFLLCYMGTKTRSLIFSEEKMEYKTSKLIFSAKYNEINLLKTFRDTNNNSQNLLILIEKNDSLSLSSSFFQLEKLQEAYKEILMRCETHINNKELSIENDLNW